MLLLIIHFQMRLFLLAFQGLNNVFDVYTKIMAQDDKLLLIPHHFQLLPISQGRSGLPCEFDADLW